MSVTSQDFQDFSITSANGTTEFEWRNACSRAYYGAYHLAQNYVQFCPNHTGNFKMGSHERLSGRFKSHGSTSARSIAIMLEAMKKIRHIADYEISDPFDQNFSLEQNASYARLKDKLLSFEQANRESKAS